MKTRAGLFICIALGLALLAAGCMPGLFPGSDLPVDPPGDLHVEGEPGNPPPAEPRHISIYFLNPSGDYLFPLSFSYDEKASASDLLKVLRAGPLRREWGKSPLPAGLDITGIDMVGERALVHLQAKDKSAHLDAGTEELLITSLVFSLTSLEGVTRVEFLQGGEKPGPPFGVLARQNLFTAADLDINPLELMGAEEPRARLWFSSRDALYMVPVTLPLTREPLDVLDRALLLIHALIEGPAGTWGLLGPFPQGTEVVNLHIQEKTLQVDFNRALVDRFPGGSSQEWALIHSLVLTLTEIEGIEQVEILIEGRKEEAALGHMDTGVPLIRGVVNWVLAD